jgi:hypothetical protein
MAANSMSNTLGTTRRQLRNHLIPASRISSDSTGEADQFPRSKVMRFAFNPRNRKILLVTGSILGVVVSRIVGTGKLGLVTGIARSLLKSKGKP